MAMIFCSVNLEVCTFYYNLFFFSLFFALWYFSHKGLAHFRWIYSQAYSYCYFCCDCKWGAPRPHYICVQISDYLGILALLPTFHNDHDLATLLNTQSHFFFLKSLLEIIKTMLSANTLYSSLLIPEYLFSLSTRIRMCNTFNCRGYSRLILLLTLMRMLL